MLLVLLALVPLAARADQKDDLKAKGDKAAAAGKPFESRDAYCQLADLDPNYPQAKMMCTMMRKEADKEDARCDQRFSDGNNDLNGGRFDDAEQKLRNVKPGCKKYDEARSLMAKLPSLKQEAAAKAGDAASAQKYDQGVQAYNRNDFGSAKSALSQVSGSKAGDAQALLNKIKQYEQAMSQGDQLANAKNFKGAFQAYNEAAGFKADGPGDPRGKAQRVQAEMADADKAAAASAAAAAAAKAEADCRAKKPVLASFQVTPNGQVGTPLKASASANPGCKAIAGISIQWGDGSQTNGNSGSHAYKAPGSYDVIAWVTDEAGNKVSQTQTVRVIEVAVRQQAPEIDVSKVLAEARVAKQKGDIRTARGKYMAVLSADKSNKEALDSLNELNKMATTTPVQPAPAEPQTPGVISEADTLLGKGITEFYTAQFDDAIFDLRNYLQFKGEKVGLANFYIGAIKATQYHLAGASDPKLQDAAVAAFKAAKKAPKFRVPEKYVSPKIIEMYNSSGM
jgi:PKD domain